MVKMPINDEWWITQKGRIYKILLVSNVEVVVLTSDGVMAIWKLDTCIEFWHHEPRCTDFNWVEPPEEIFPQYWTSPMVGSKAIYMKRVSSTEYFTVMPSGEIGPLLFWERSFPHLRVQITETEALALLDKPPEPAEVWPKYYVGKNWSDGDAYVRVDSKDHEFIWVSADGSEQDTYVFRYDDILLYGWRDITEAEAKERVTPVDADPSPFSKPFTNPRSGMGIRKEPVETLQQLCEFCTQPLTDDGRCLFSPCIACDIQADIEPVESPDDWVTQDTVHMRLGVDQFRWVSTSSIQKFEFEGDWKTYDGFTISYMHGDTKDDSRYRIEIQCRRKDLPVSMTLLQPEQPPTPVESPDDIILIPHRDFVFSDKIEQRQCYATAQWKPCDPSIHGNHCSEEPWWHAHYEFRCLRKDLPVEQPTPQRVPVRLWAPIDSVVSGTLWPTAIVSNTPPPNTDFGEIKHDEKGFYIEG